MPAAAVIPAPIAYIKVVAVKKLVVESVSHTVGSPLAVSNWHVCGTSYRWAQPVKRRPNSKSYHGALHRVSRWAGTFTLNKLECLKQAHSPEYSVHGIME